MKLVLLFTGLLALSLNAAAQVVEDQPIDCASCAAWNEPQVPFRIFGNTWYVGTAGLSAVLVVSEKGLILLDGALPQSASIIAKNIQTLGFDPAQIKFLLNSHAHFDHAGGLAALQRYSQAQVLASKASVAALSSGRLQADDPQYGFGPEASGFPAVDEVSVIKDGASVTLGEVELTAHYTPGHTPGGTTWTWTSCAGERCVDIVYADSLGAISAEGYRFSDPSRNPSGAEQVRASAERIRQMPCDILLVPHPFLFNMNEKLAARASGSDAQPFIEVGGCQKYADTADKSLARRLEKEQSGG